MSSKTVVVVLHDNGSTHGKVSEFHHAQDAEHFVESLLEAGFEQRSIRVLALQNLDMLVTHRPAVSLVPTHLVRKDLPAAENGDETLPIQEDVPTATHVATFESAREKDLVPVGASSDSQLHSAGHQVGLTLRQGSLVGGWATSDVEPIWAPTGDGAELIMVEDPIPAVSRK